MLIISYKIVKSTLAFQSILAIFVFDIRNLFLMIRGAFLKNGTPLSSPGFFSITRDDGKDLTLKILRIEIP